jgi:signal-transduction protein with cAMP-binding, CBS, and nucleotidyltransferase domain
MKKVGELIRNREIYHADPGWTVSQAARFMKERDIGAVAIMEEGQMKGIFTERDLMSQVVAENLDPKSTKVSEVMTREIVTADPDEFYEECLAKMQQKHCRHLPVISKGKLIGVISLRDLLQVDASEKLERAKVLDYLLRYDMTVGEYDSFRSSIS